MNLEDFLEQLTQWHQHQVAQLNLVIDNPDLPLKFQSEDGLEVELTAQQAKGFRLGVQQSLKRLGTLPFTVSRDEEE